MHSRHNTARRIRLESPSPARPQLARSNRIVIKLGTNVLVNSDGTLDDIILANMVRSVSHLKQQGRSIILVSSGAVGLGRAMLPRIRGLGSSTRQAQAAVGQGQLMGRYSRELARVDLTSAQVLVTEQDFETRKRYLDLRETLNCLLRSGVVPVLNDNDVVSHGARSVDEEGDSRAVFDDNDRLSALVAAKCEADLLLILTDVDGVYDLDPKNHDEARRFSRLDDPSAVLETVLPEPGSPTSRGGMRSKIESAIVARSGGCHVVIASGHATDVVTRTAAGQDIGTWIPSLRAEPALRRWIAYAAVPKGVLTLDHGAVRALYRQRASLLVVGVTAVQGDFRPGDVVELRRFDGTRVGRALIDHGAESVRSWIRGDEKPSRQNCLIRRDCIVLRRES